MKKNILIICLFVLSTGIIFAEASEKKTYEEGERLFDEKKYEEAIEKYLSVADNTFYYLESNDKRRRELISDGIEFDSNGEAKLLYYSLYNVACCYSLMGNFSKARQYLIAALHAGYPFINYILKDADMQPFFASDPSLKSEIQKIFNQGNSRALVNGKKFEIWDLNDCHRYGFDGNTVIRYCASSDWLDHKYKGTYEVKNYHIIMHFTRKTYRKPDPWASSLPGGGTITSYTSYSEYPEFESANYKETLRLPLGLDDDGSWELKEIESYYTSDWEEHDYSELIEKRRNDYYSVDRKIKRTTQEIAASAARRRKKVLDYINKVGRDSPTVFILPEGTKTVNWGDINIPDGTVAVLLPEGLETLIIRIPSSVKYINFPSTLKKLIPDIYSDSQIEAIELPENLEELGDILFWYNSNEYKRWDVYVPGWSETPPEWHKAWDMYCNVHYGEYLKD